MHMFLFIIRANTFKVCCSYCLHQFSCFLVVFRRYYLKILFLNMPRPKRNAKYYKAYTHNDMQAAITAVQGGQFLYRAAKQHGIPYNSLKDQIRRHQEGRALSLGSPTHLAPGEEEELENWVNMCQLLGYPRSWNHIKVAASMICTNNHGPNCKHAGLPPSFQWLNGFRKRHPTLKTRMSESITKAAANVGEADIRGWFKDCQQWLVANCYEHILHDPQRIFGGDETSFYLSRGKQPVVAKEGTTSVLSVEQTTHENVTVLYTFGAKGTVLKPLIVLQGKTKPKNQWGDDVLVEASENGWMTSDLFCQWISQHFVPELKSAGVQFPVLLFMDGHKSHVTLDVSTNLKAGF